MLPLSNAVIYLFSGRFILTAGFNPDLFIMAFQISFPDNITLLKIIMLLLVGMIILFAIRIFFRGKADKD